MSPDCEARIRVTVAAGWGIGSRDAPALLAALDEAREQCRAAEAQATVLRAGLIEIGYGRLPVPNGDMARQNARQWLERARDVAAPAPEPEQRPDEHQFVPMSGSSVDGVYQRCSVDGCRRTPEEHRQPDQPQPSLGRHAGLAGHEGEG